MIKRFLILITFISSLQFLCSCNKNTCHDVTNPKCKNYDPCYDKVPVEANFKILENIGGTAFEGDTVWCNNWTHFWALGTKNKGLNISWRLRGGSFYKTYTDTFVTFNAAFDGMPTDCFYTVTCVASREASSCKEQKSIDSVSKIFYMWPKEFPNDNYWNNPISSFKYLPIFGTYAGYKQSKPNELVYVTLFDSVIQQPLLYCENPANNLPIRSNIIANLGYNNVSTYKSTRAYSGAFLNTGVNGILLYCSGYFGTNCSRKQYYVGYNGIAALDPTNQKKIIINYHWTDSLTNEWRQDFFTGTRIPKNP